MRLVRNLHYWASICLFFSVVFHFCHAWGIQVNSYYGRYETHLKMAGFPSKSLQGPVLEQWKTSMPLKPYRIGVLFPHINDLYFNTASWAVMSHARRLGVDVTLYTAGSYANFGDQRMQLQYLAGNARVDGILLTSVDYDKMDSYVLDADRAGIPVVALINDIRAPAIRAKIYAPFFDIGSTLCQYVLQHADTHDVRVAFFPGPETSEWAPATYQGFVACSSQSGKGGKKLTLIDPLYGDTRPDVQRLRLNTLDNPEHHHIDYIIGNAVAAVEAVAYLKDHARYHPTAKILSTYITPTVYEEIRQGHITAAPSDQTISQCQVALDMMVRILNGEIPGKDMPFLALPEIDLITTENIDRVRYESLFGDKSFTPVLQTIEDF